MLGGLVMNLEDINRANELVDMLTDAIDAQAKALADLEKSLQDYVDFLQNSIKEIRDGE